MKPRLLAYCLWILAVLPTSHAVQWVQRKDYILQAGEQVLDELWVTVSQFASLDGRVGDDLFVLASKADLNGIFDGDVFAIAPQINFSGVAHDQVRLGGGTILVRGRIERSLLAGADTVTVENDAQVCGDLILMAEQAIFKGSASNAYIISKKATVSGTVYGNLRLVSDDIVILPGAEVHGDVVYTSSQELALDSRVRVHGTLRRTWKWPGGFEPKETDWRSAVNLQLYRYVAALLVALATASLFPGITGASVRTLRARAGWCGMAGFIALASIPMVIVVSLFTFIGLPLGLVLMAIYLLLLYLAKIPVALWLGSVVLRMRGPTPFRTIFAVLSIGLFLLYAVAALPYIGSIMAGVVAIFGLGAVLTALFAQDRALLRSFREPSTMPPPLPTKVSQDYTNKKEA